uniref:Asparagine synthase n=1 Tax=Candidatus Kentrum sp. SD TaxID=2126332 RepID=A0A451BN14_9GAMM|nr:MAG: hypothetical protein BECKSD772D_GA0070982_106013 [Candidatus Kentron sp. SD]
MQRNKVIFLNSNQAKSGYLYDVQLPEEYVFGCRFLGCGIIDRTHTLDFGFDYSVLDLIPEENCTSTIFSELCDGVGIELTERAIESKKNIRVLWSGGIDSTVALISLMKASEKLETSNYLQVMLTMDSVNEYPDFYKNYIIGKYKTIPCSSPISEFLELDCVNVTGEHGDQLFGSHLLKEEVETGSAYLKYKDVLPLKLMQFFSSSKKVDRLMKYIEPQIDASPIRINTLFDCIWWLNFSLKWQQVTLRLPVFRMRDVEETYNSIYHFFRDSRFQAWSLANSSLRKEVFAWKDYKSVAKEYIYSFANDSMYRSGKVKEPSLKKVMVKRNVRKNHFYRISMKEDFIPDVTLVERKRT